MKRVRMLLRVSSNQQLEADGDLSVQRQIVREYICRQTDWKLDTKEYFEGSVSGYQNSVKERDVLQEALLDAGKGEYDILAAYKDDRIGRRMWEIGAYVMQLKNCGVDIYTVKDGCISPDCDDIMGQMMLALRYGNAQKSSADTGIRVKDTAQKLVQKGKFMGGCAPYGYRLALSGEISKHGRALHELVIIPERAEAVKYIYELSLYQEYGTGKIAQILNTHERFKDLAPKTVWKSGTVNSILTNPIYTGHTAYKRREHINGKYQRLEPKEWIISAKANDKIRIIDEETWDRTQEKRKQRRVKGNETHPAGTVIRRNAGNLACIDVAYCGYCKGKLVNGTKYNYWTIKQTGEKRKSRTPIYQCANARQGIPHREMGQYRADKIEPIVFDIVAKCIARLLEEEEITAVIARIFETERKEKEEGLKKEEKKLAEIRKKIAIMENSIPDAMEGKAPFTAEELAGTIRNYKQQAADQAELIRRQETELKNVLGSDGSREYIDHKNSSWQELFYSMDISTKRALIVRLIEKIEVKKDEITIRFQLNGNDFWQKRQKRGDSGVPEQRV